MYFVVKLDIFSIRNILGKKIEDESIMKLNIEYQIDNIVYNLSLLFFFIEFVIILVLHWILWSLELTLHKLNDIWKDIKLVGKQFSLSKSCNELIMQKFQKNDSI